MDFGVLSLPVTNVPGAGPARARLLARLGVETVGGLLHRPPGAYVDLRRPLRVQQLEEGRTASVSGVIVASAWRRARRRPGLWIGTAGLRDEAGDELRLIWFANVPPRRRPRPLPIPDPGQLVVATGPVRKGGDGLYMSAPDVEPAGEHSLHTGRIVPVYSLTEGLTQKVMRGLVWSALTAFAADAKDALSDLLEGEPGVASLSEALRQLHFPEDWDGLHRARRRLALAELLLVRLAAALGRRDGTRQRRPLALRRPAFIERLPFEPTSAQRRVLQAIDEDLSAPRPMQRLLQGDVGSGKTVPVAWALARAAAAGGQGALIAPSDALARQHCATIASWLAGDGIDVHLLTGATPAGTRRALLERLAEGEPGIVVGTHALLQPTVRFARLDVVVVDEQHRFGVEQRRALLRSTRPPHLLVVSATPIPRTLALCLYGDLDVSLLDELPAGRLPVDTRWVRPSRRDEVYRFLRRRVQAGERAFVVFPAIGEEGDPIPEDDGDAPARLLQRARELAAGPLAGLAADVVHGRQTPAEQGAAFDRFRRGETSVLLATTVVEVGIDVPEATVIVIEDADMFGLAQLHQLRGRVGRGGGQSWCFLVADPKTAAARERLQAMRESNDGFQLARRDLELRGPGELLGVRQSGLPDLSPVARAAGPATFELVERWARRLLAAGERAARPEEAAVWEAARRWRGQPDEGAGV